MYLSAYPLAIVCYDPPANRNCFWTNYKCTQFSCTKTSTPCYCKQLTEAITDIVDEKGDRYLAMTDGDNVLQIKHEDASTWDNVYNMGGLELNEVWRVGISCEFDRVIINIYDSVQLEGGASESEAYLRTINVSYELSNC